MAQPSVDLSLLEPILAEYADQKGALIPILQHAQDEYGYLPAPVLDVISERTGTPLSKIYLAGASGQYIPWPPDPCADGQTSAGIGVGVYW